MLESDELTVPAEDGVWPKEGGDLEEPLAADSLALDCKASPLIVGQSRAFAIVKLEQNSVLLDQELNDVSLLSIEPARGRSDEQVEWRKDSVHAGDGSPFAVSEGRLRVVSQGEVWA